ncbi:protein kinase [Microtetraspora sp. AC03309]|uniref:serine/threonine-protein kinase n=1 Tax=Microtetraspora sp. AC03309 TaxID=2779376 RepID=UPI001E4ECF77|nr:serine/threonine-protein kinase [Microtetraspora sp. AC03309]MCC5578927.1 protein kinase [Microtetraspora sp. AC03309]
MTEGPSTPAGLVGRTLGDYTIEAVVGRGGMATVYRARDRRLGRAVALKILAPQLAHDHRFRERFVRESRLVASIDHPNIIPIYEAGEKDELLFIAMRYVEGSDMRRLVQSAGPLPVARANRLFAQIASALDSAHANGLVHRDVKPANILVADDDHVYLTDFGLTKSSSAEAGLTSHGHFMGTPRYVAPEQIRGLPVDGRSDLYAFACVAYEALTGLPPFQRDTELALLYAHVSHEPPPLTPYRPDLPHAVNQVTARALAKSPEERYPTCQAFVSALRDAISGSGGVHGGVRGGDGDEAAASPAHGRPGFASGPSSGHSSYPPGSSASTSYPPVSHPSTSRPPTSYPPTSHPTSHPTSNPPGSRDDGAATAPAKRGRRLPLGPLIGGCAVLVSIVVAAALILTRGGDTSASWNTYPGSVAAPFTIAYPSTWGTAKTNGDQWMIATPATDEFNALFAIPGNTDWSTVNPIISGQPERASGIFAQVNNALSTSDSPVELQQSLQSALPGNVAFTGAPMAVTVGARPAVKLTGVAGDPQQGGRLDFSAYVVRQETGESSVLITFFCAKCDQSLIDHMVNTVQFTP